MTASLDSLKPGAVGIIQDIRLAGIERRRLMDLGFVKDTAVQVDVTSAMGDPRAYRIMDTLIALRRETASQIIVQIQENKIA